MKSALACCCGSVPGRKGTSPPEYESEDQSEKTFTLNRGNFVVFPSQEVVFTTILYWTKHVGLALIIFVILAPADTSFRSQGTPLCTRFQLRSSAPLFPAQTSFRAHPLVSNFLTPRTVINMFIFHQIDFFHMVFPTP